LQSLSGTLTPSDLHFERHHAGIPALEAATHELVIHGLVGRSQKFTLADLQRLPSVTRTCFIECSGNLIALAGTPEKSTAQLLAGLTSQSEWTGVALSTLLREVEAKDSATWLLAEGGDASVLSRSIPMEKAWDDAIIAYAQNGEPLRPGQGYPFRLLLPGWEGNTNVKWLRRLELGDAPFMTREETAKYSEPVKGRGIRQFSFQMDPRSIITSPSVPDTINKGWLEISGLAWSGAGRIRDVEVSTDAGKTWTSADLKGPVLPKAHTRFGLMWQWNGEETVIMSRAIDEQGSLQPTAEQIIAHRGIGSKPYHLNPVLGWHVQKSGEVLFAAEEMDMRLATSIPAAILG
jgi:sulfane dehydrogenase subunit SoxC